MCDETTEEENRVYLEELQLSRRQVGVTVGVAATALLAGCATSPTTTSSSAPASAPASAAPPAAEDPPAKPSTNGLATRDRMVSIDTPDGKAEAFFVTPTAGQHPGVILWPDIAGVRDAYRKMATRLAEEGYAVLVVNQYYRSGKLPFFDTISQWRNEGGMAKVRPMMALLTSEAVATDGATFARWIDQQDEVDTNRKIGAMGYCMGGPFTIRTAAAAPERVGVIASFHGGRLVTDKDDSPHLLLGKTKVAALICIASSDDKKQPEAKDALRKSAADAKLTADIEVYPTQHGWCTIDAPVYDREQAEKARSKMLAMFKEHL